MAFSVRELAESFVSSYVATTLTLQHNDPELFAGAVMTLSLRNIMRDFRAMPERFTGQFLGIGLGCLTVYFTSNLEKAGEKKIQTRRVTHS